MLKWIDKYLKYVFTLPTIIFTLSMIAFPIVYTFSLSFNEWSMSNSLPREWVGLENYRFFLTDKRFHEAFFRTFAYAFVSLFLETVLGLAAAMFLSKVVRAKSIIKTAFLLPMVATPVAVGLGWKLIYEPTIGVLNHLLKVVGIPGATWLGSADTVIGSLIAIDVWQWTPMIVLILLAGIASLPREPYESSVIDGGNGLQIFYHITLPLLSSTILVAAMLRLIDALKTFDIIYSTTNGGPNYASENLNILSYKYAFEYYYFGKASALLILFFIIVLGFTFLFMLMKKKLEVEY